MTWHGARVVGAAACEQGPADLEDAFPTRWDPRRALGDDARALAAATSRALVAAGWWAPGSGAAVPGGLVVGVDGLALGPASTFWSGVARARPLLRPAPFLQLLPSTPAATLGLLFGLSDYQATCSEGGLAGVSAAGHALDLLRAARLARAVVAALSVAPPDERLARAAGLPGPGFRLAVALCLEPASASDPALVDWDEGVEPGGPEDALETGRLLGDLPPGYRGLAAPGLLGLARAGGWLCGPDPAPAATRVSHDDPPHGRRVAVELRREE